MSSNTRQKKSKKSRSVEAEPIQLLRKDPEISRFGKKLAFYSGLVLCALGFVLANHLLKSASGRNVSLKPAELNLPEFDAATELNQTEKSKNHGDLLESLQRAQETPEVVIPGI